jgi:hypothetical protein
MTANPQQEDLDKDGQGDACDDDIDGDGIANKLDPNPQKHDTPLYFAEKLGAAAGDQSAVPPASWSAQGDAYCHSQTTDKVEWTQLQKSLTPDVLVESVIVVQGQTPPPKGFPRVGLTVRLVTSPGFRAVVCWIDPADGRLILGRYWDGNYNGDYKASAAGSVATTPWPRAYRLRASADGDKFSCELVPGGPLLTAQSTWFSSGNAGLIASDVTACYQSLLVLPL